MSRDRGGRRGEGRKRDAYAVEFPAAIVDGHVSAFPRIETVSEELIHEVIKGEAALFEDAGFSVLGPDDIFGR